jgi:hypothetical protein
MPPQDTALRGPLPLSPAVSVLVQFPIASTCVCPHVYKCLSRRGANRKPHDAPVRRLLEGRHRLSCRLIFLAFDAHLYMLPGRCVKLLCGLHANGGAMVVGEQPQRPIPQQAQHRTPCRRCGASTIRRSHPRSFRDRLLRILGMHPVRCAQCLRRFYRFRPQFPLAE